jgi:hypothetical protein
MGASAAVEGAVAAPTPAPQSSQPRVVGDTDGRHAWLHAEYKGLLVRKIASKADRTVTIDVRYQRDALTVALNAQGVISVTRGRSTVAITTPDALAAAQTVLAGSEAMFALRALLAERESVSDLKAHEMALLATTAFVVSIGGDTDAPRRLASRFVAKHRGIIMPVRDGCWDKYAKESTAAWNDLNACMDEANQDESWFSAAYRRLACNAVWALRVESAWFEYLECLSPLSVAK